MASHMIVFPASLTIAASVVLGTGCRVIDAAPLGVLCRTKGHAA